MGTESSSNRITNVFSHDNSYAVILANGTFPSSSYAQRYFYNASKLICCDGATQKACEHGRIPDVIIGDCDSISPATKERFQDRVIHISEQETNDLAKAFRFCLNQGWKSIVILGATGEREDHTLGNISYLFDFVQKANDIRMVTDFGVFFPVKNSPSTFSCIKGQQISIFSIDPHQKITSCGLKYPLDRLRLPLWYMGTLNQASSDSFNLEFDETSPILLFFTNEIK